MEKRQLEEGDLVQINPENEHQWGGFFAVVTEPKTWGFQGYLLSARDFEAVKFKGRAFVRIKFEDCEYVGKVTWIEEDKLDDEKTNLI